MKLGSWLCPIVASKLSPFLDDIHYEIKWVGEQVNFGELGYKYEEEDFVVMKTANQEEYKCFFPSKDKRCKLSFQTACTRRRICLS